MVVGEVATATDVLVIGGGPGGYAAALRVAGRGLTVTLVERDAIGGTCLNVGCIPSKVLIHASELTHLAETSARTGVTLSAKVDIAQVHEHMTSVVTGLTDGVGSLLNTAGVVVIAGTARFASPSRVVVASDAGVSHIEFGQAIIASGSRPVVLPAFPVDGARIVDSTGALFSGDTVPDSLTVIGGGYIGVELGTAWAKLGAAVTIVEATDSLLPGLDARLSRVVHRRLKELNVTVLLNTRAVKPTATGLTIDGPDGQQNLDADRIVVSVGRRPNTDDLGLDVVGIEPTSTGHITVDASRRANRRILAIGDVTNGPALAHKATAEAEVAAITASGGTATFDPACVPAVVFSDPEVATVGLTLDEARTQGIDAERFVFPLGASARARTLDAATGHAELVVDEEGSIIGAHLAGPHVSELISQMAFAIEMAATAEEVAATIHPHPTMSESLLEAALGAIGTPLHVSGR